MHFKPTTKADERWLLEGGYYDKERPKQVKAFAEAFCSIADRPGKFEFLPWQFDNVICPLYGCRNKDDSNRFTRGSVWCPRGLCKSITCSVILLYELFRVDAPQVIISSSSVECAQQIFNFAVHSIDNGPLKDLLHVKHHLREIHLKTGSGFAKVLSGGKKGKSGQGITCCIFDELGEVSDDCAWHRLYDSSRKREKDNPIWLSISSPQYERYDLPWSQYEKAKAIIDGDDDDPNYLARIVSVPEEIPIDDVEQCAKYLPNVPAVVSLKKLKQEYDTAKNSPRDLARYQNHSLGRWAYGSANYWLDWSKIDKAFKKFTEESLHGQRCFLGIDGSVSNLSCYVLYFPDTKQVIPRFFMPKDTINKETKSGTTLYIGNEKYITITEGDLFDWKTVKTKIEQDLNTFQVEEIGFDPFRLECAMVEYIQELQVKASVVPPYKSHVSRPTKEMERLIISEELNIQFNPIAKWNLRNAVAKFDEHERIVLDRDKATGRYDFCSALVIALHRVIAHEANYVQVFTAT